jgi:hypothetical protein
MKFPSFGTPILHICNSITAFNMVVLHLFIALSKVEIYCGVTNLRAYKNGGYGNT